MANYKKNIELTRVNINLPTNLVERVKEYALKMGLNTTNAYVVLLNNGLDQKRTIDFLGKLIENLPENKDTEFDKLIN